MNNDLQTILDAHKKFTHERDWDRFQTPKNLCMALSVEASELVEIFMWLTEKQADSLKGQQLQAASEELADIFIYLLRISDVLGVDLVEAAKHKMKKNCEKHTVEKAVTWAQSWIE